MEDKLWWRRPLRVIQDNLQVLDTPLMDPEKIAQDTLDMHANVLVINAGGIYAWYPTDVPYHHRNEYLPKEYDLFGRLIEECHKRGIRLVARFDFSKTDDYVSQERPEWFVRNPDGSMRAYGAERPGNWSILYTTCINSGYRNEEVAVPVLREVLDRYDIDGIFLNAPHYEYCTCDACRKKYEKLYHKPLPLSYSGVDQNSSFSGSTGTPADLEPGFAGVCYRDNIAALYSTVKEKRPEVPLILYYSLYNENLRDRLQTADMICTEAQNVLSRGVKDIPPAWTPTLIMKMGRSAETGFQPFGIIHSCPGMDWRHTGMPQAEYRHWLREIPSAGGTLWHSITGFADTISDKRILRAVSDVNEQIEKIEDDMDGAQERSDVLVLWNDHETDGWAQLLTGSQTQFSVRSPYQIDGEVLAHYPVVLVSDAYPLTREMTHLLKQYAREGGHLIIEGTSAEQLAPFADVIGIRDSVRTSEYLTACYFRLEDEGECLKRGLEDTPILPVRGVIAYTRALEGTHVLATLIPPFAPLHAVGSPPERASMRVKHTDIPLCTQKDCGKGTVTMLPFRLGELTAQYGLAEFYHIWNRLMDSLLGSSRVLAMEPSQGLTVNLYRKDDSLLLHMVNGLGQRPLVNAVDYTNLSCRLALPEGMKVRDVQGVLSDAEFDWKQEDDGLEIRIDRLKLWEMFRITMR